MEEQCRKRASYCSMAKYLILEVIGWSVAVDVAKFRKASSPVCGCPDTVV